MKRLAALVTILALAYGGYWFLGRSAAVAALDTGTSWLTENGWDIAQDDRQTRGFPSRFDTTFTAPRVIAPLGAGLSGPWLQILALAWAPNRAIIAFPPEMTLHLPDGSASPLRAEGLRASAILAPSLSLPLDAVTVESGPIFVGLDAGPLRADRLLLAFRAAPEAEPGYDLFGELTALVLPPAVTARLDPAAGLPDGIARLTFDGRIFFTRPLDRVVLSAGLPPPTALEIRSATLVWGQTNLSISGTLDLTGTEPSGQLDLTMTGWPALLDIAAAFGLIDRDSAAQARLALMLTNSGTGSLGTSLTLENGRMVLGSLPIGPIPRF